MSLAIWLETRITLPPPSTAGGACVDQYKVEYSATGSSWGSTYELFP